MDRGGSRGSQVNLGPKLRISERLPGDVWLLRVGRGGGGVDVDKQISRYGGHGHFVSKLWVRRGAHGGGK